MSMEHSEESSSRRATVSDVVFVSRDGDGFACVPTELITRGEAARERASELPGVEVFDGEGPWSRATSESWLDVIEVLRSEGFVAQPNHVFFAHGCGASCPPHPSLTYELLEAGAWANPLKANPLKANPLKANPLKANPLKANPLKANHPMENTAVPAEGRLLPTRTLAGPGSPPTVVVIDTGLAKSGSPRIGSPDYCPPLIDLAAGINGDLDVPDATIQLLGAVYPPDRYLDPVAGHGTFIAGLIEQLAPGCVITAPKVIQPLGNVTEWEVAAAMRLAVARHLAARAAAAASGQATPQCIISLSFGGQTLDQPALLREAVADALLAGIPVVASAGNDGLCTPQYPAAFPNVIAVGALGPDGPAPWTNYGDWVDACAPGSDLVSAFFDGWDGEFPMMNSFDADSFTGWATWSGTSFAAPVVVAALAREIVQGGCSAVEAVERVIRAPHLMRIPCLGTVVNI